MHPAEITKAEQAYRVAVKVKPRTGEHLKGGQADEQRTADHAVGKQAARRIDAGLSAGVKFAMLGGIALLAAVLLWAPGGLGIDKVFVPGSRVPLHLGVAIVPLAVLAIAGSAHAVNLTDGLDGLAGHTSAVASASYGVIAYLQGQICLVTFCFTIAGALLAFLWFNAYSAQVFMGDTSALALGATLAVVALMLGQVLLLPMVGPVFVAITMSVMLQIGYFKATSGKRLFRMAPLHLHFEAAGPAGGIACELTGAPTTEFPTTGRSAGRLDTVAQLVSCPLDG